MCWGNEWLKFILEKAVETTDFADDTDEKELGAERVFNHE